MRKFSLLLLLSIPGLAWAQEDVGVTNPQRFQLISSVVNEGGMLPAEFTCDGSDFNPSFDIQNPPPKTAGYVLIVQNPTATEGVWTHWLIYNIKPETTTIPMNAQIGTPLLSDFGDYRYHGPCPVDDKGIELNFRLIALKEILFNMNEGATVKDLEKAVRGKILVETTFHTKYARQKR